MTKFFLLVALFFLVGCHEPKPKSYQEGNTLHLNSIRWGANDLQLLSKMMVQDILGSAKVLVKKEDVYFFEKIRNDTHDQMDTRLLKNKIITALILGKQFHFTDEKSKADYLFKGKLSSLFKKDNKGKDMFFTFNMTLVNPQTADIVWSHDVEIRKVYERSLLGW
jgi:PBP1b-binding outer membrane lipoprotein LpoB